MTPLAFGNTRGPRPIPAWDRLDNRGAERPEPVAEQAPRRYCILLLKGMQTRWADTRQEVRMAAANLNLSGRAHVVYEFTPALGCYSSILGEAEISC